MRRALVVLVFVCGAVMTLAPPAGAHAALLSSDPPDGALLVAPPAAITLTFTEPPDPELSTVQVLDQTGKEVVVGAAARAQGNVLRTPFPESLPDGVYTVSWHVVSEVDGHVTASAFAFGVGVDPASVPVPDIPETTTPGPTPAAIGGRVLLYAGIAILVAAAVVGGLAFGGRMPARRPLLLAASGSLVAGIALLVTAQASTVGVGLMELFGSRAGRPNAWLAGVGVATAAAGVEAAQGSGRRGLFVAGVGAAAAALVRSIGGHAAAAPTPFPLVVQWIHVLAISTWIGGLVLLALRARRTDERLAADARRFSRIVVLAAPLAVVTGVLRATTELEGIGWLLRAFDTSYGTTLAIKLTAVAGLLALGALNRYRNIGMLEAGRPTPLRRAVLGEVIVAAGVLGLTGTLTGLPPRPEPTQAPAETAIVARATDFASTVEIRLRASPGRPGPNRFSVRLVEPGSGTPLMADAVSLRFEPLALAGVPASSLDLAPVDGAWTGQGSNLSLAGTWEIRATVLRGAESVEVPLVVTTAAPPATITTAEAPGQPTLTTATLPDGVSLQTYLDPSDPGTNQVHVTAFDPAGGELPLDTATFVAFPPVTPPAALAAERFGEGHFVATVELVPGRWRFALTATTRDGQLLQTSFSRTIGGSS